MCSTCASKIQQELWAMLTNHIVPGVAYIIYIGCIKLRMFNMGKCLKGKTAFRDSLSTVVMVAGLLLTVL